MATVKKPSKNMIRGSWFGNATVTLNHLANLVVGVDLVQEYKDALMDIAHLYETGDDLNRLIIGQAPVNGMDAKDVPKHQRFCKAVQDIKDKAKEKGIPLQLGYTDTWDDLEPVWYVDVSSPETEVFEIKVTPYGRQILKIICQHGIAFDTHVTECY
jgi:hypothetical protein